MTNSKHTDIYNIVGQNIKKYRELNGYTQRSLSEALLLSESFIGKLESHTHQTISIDTLKLIADFLNTDIRRFFDDIEKK